MNFSNVKEATGGEMVLPGTKAIFTIESVEHGTSTNGKDYLLVNFTSEAGSFKHYFYLVDGALSRIQHLWKHSHGGNELSGEVSIEGLIAGLKGKRVALKVTGRIGNNGKTYPDLPFGGFAADATEEGLASLEFSAREQNDIVAALKNLQNQSVQTADAEISDANAF
jgi:hypothetical protein